MDNLWITLITIIFASQGFWTFLSQAIEKKRKKTPDLSKELENVKNDTLALKTSIKGLCHYKIIEVCNKFSDDGYISDDDYESLYENLWMPYHAGLGGNGTAQRAMERVEKLPRNLT